MSVVHTVPTVFSSGYPSQSYEWSLEAEAPLTPLRGQLNLAGVREYTVGTRLSVDAVTYVVTNVSRAKSGMGSNTALTVRDLLYDLYRTTPDKNYTWVTAPDYFTREEILSAIAQPVITELRVRKGDIFGVGGWHASDIVKQLADMLSLSVSYGIPDFWVKQASIDRSQSILEFLSGFLAPLLPRMYVAGSTLFIVPMKQNIATSFTASVCEELTESTTYAEPYKKFRITGGVAQFDKTKWEGRTLLVSDGTGTYSLLVSGSAGYVTVSAPCGIRKYYQTLTTSVSTSKVLTVYAKDIFGNNSHIIFKQEWRFNRKKPVALTSTSAAYKFAQDYFQQFGSQAVYEGTDPIPWPTAQTHWLDQCDRVIYVHKATDASWEAPLLVEEHHSIWKHLWWSKLSASGSYQTNPPTASTHPNDLGGAFPATFPTAYTQVASVDDSRNRDVVGVWNTNAYWESTYYHYDSEKLVGDASEAEALAKKYKYEGGLLWWKLTKAQGVCVSLVPNLKDTGGYAVRDVPDFRLTPAYQIGTAGVCPMTGILDDPTGGIRVIREVREDYKAINMRTVMRTTRTIEMDPEWYSWYDDKDNYGGELNGITQYKSSFASDLVPFEEAPQTVVKMRGMECYTQKTGSGARYIDISCPHVVSWADLDRVAAHIWKTHPDQQHIRTFSVRVPGKYRIHPAIFGGTLHVSSEVVTGRIVGAYYEASGSGENQTVFMLQDEVSP